MSKQQKQTYMNIVAPAIIGLLMFTLMGKAGKLEPSGPPESTMRSLDEIYNAVVNANETPTIPQEAWFIKFDGVDGESTDEDHIGWSDILSFNHGIFQPLSEATGAERRRGDVTLEDVICSKTLDKISPKIAESVCKSKVYPVITIDFIKTHEDGHRLLYFQYELKNAMVTNYKISGSLLENETLSEKFWLNYEEIRVTYTEYDDEGRKKGDVEYSWKVEEGEAL